MKQTKKLARNQRELLERKGIENASEYRFVKETSTEYVFYHEERKETLRIEK